MNRLIKFEFRKLFRQKSFYICAAITVALIFLMAWTNQLMEFLMSDPMIQDPSSIDSPYSGLYMLVSALYNCNLVDIILPIFLALFVCSDYNNGTLKNVFARGYDRISVYASKFIVSLAGVTFYVLLDWLSGFLSGVIFWEAGSLGSQTVGDYVLALLLQLLLVYAYTSIYFFLCVLLRKTGASIPVGILAPILLEFVISIIDMLTKAEPFAVSDYWLSTFLSALSKLPIESDLMTRSLVCSLIYLVVFGVGAHLIGRKHQV